MASLANALPSSASLEVIWALATWMNAANC